MKKCRMFILIGFSFFSISLSHADLGFYRPWNSPHDRNRRTLPEAHTPLNLVRARAAAIQIIEGNEFPVNSSGVTISKDGYVLTAAHVVEGCLRDHGMLNVLSEGKNKILETLNSTPNVVCDNLSSPSFTGRVPTLVYVGRGVAQWPDLENISPEFIQKIKSTQDDFAILKFPGHKASKCIPIARNLELKTGDLLWGIGFPGATYRGPEDDNGFPDSDGQDQFISYGKIYPDITHNAYYTTIYPTFVEARHIHYTQKMLDLNRELLSGSNLVISNIDLFFGMSGSPGINEAGDLVALNVGTSVPNRAVGYYFYVDGASVSVRLSSILQELDLNVGELKRREFFNCAP